MFILYLLFVCIIAALVARYVFIPLIALASGLLCAVAWIVNLLFVECYHAYTTISRKVKQ